VPFQRHCVLVHDCVSECTNVRVCHECTTYIYKTTHLDSTSLPTTVTVHSCRRTSANPMVGRSRAKEFV
jgi:hypothetical protein